MVLCPIRKLILKAIENLSKVQLHTQNLNRDVVSSKL
jgi:hypothetical protein